MSYNSNPKNDYTNDIIPDQSVPALTESISSIAWANNIGPIFAATLWDGSIRIFEVAQGQYGQTASIQQKMTNQYSTAVTKSCWSLDNTQLYFGCADGSIKSLDINTSAIMDVGKNASAISSLHCIPGQNVLISTSYDKIVNFWQPGNQQPIFNIDLMEKVYTADFSFPVLVTGMSNEKIGIIDINNMGQKTIIDSAELGKNSQLQSISINSKATTYGVATFDGRANISEITRNQSAGGYSQTMSKIVDLQCLTIDQANPSSLFQELDNTVCNKQMLGTPIFYSPEMLHTNKMQIHDDIWAFGILMFELLCGYYPFERDSNEPSYKIKPFKSQVPSDIRHLIVSLLSYQYDKRPKIDEIIRFLCK